MSTANITIIGAGNMGACLLGGLLTNNYPPEHLWISNPTLEKLHALQKKWASPFYVTTQNIEAIRTADIIILAVKPLVMPSVLEESATIIQERQPLVISTAAGVQNQIIQHYLGSKTAIIRAMPNTPAMVGLGATALYPNKQVSPAQKERAESIFQSVGTTLWIENEKWMDAITAVSGCGPAYYFLVNEAIQEAGEKLGLPTEIARLLTLQTAYGATHMALFSDQTCKELRQQVTSKGGTTEQAIRVLEESNIRDIFATALSAARQRADELATILRKKIGI